MEGVPTFAYYYYYYYYSLHFPSFYFTLLVFQLKKKKDRKMYFIYLNVLVITHTVFTSPSGDGTVVIQAKEKAVSSIISQIF